MFSFIYQALWMYEKITEASFSSKPSLFCASFLENSNFLSYH